MPYYLVRRRENPDSPHFAAFVVKAFDHLDSRELAQEYDVDDLLGDENTWLDESKTQCIQLREAAFLRGVVVSSYVNEEQEE